MFPAPNFQPGQHAHIPHGQWLIKVNPRHSRATAGTLQTYSHSCQFFPALTLGLFLSFGELLLLLGKISEIGLLHFDL